MNAKRSLPILLVLSCGLQLDAASRIQAQPGYVAKGVIASQPDGTLLLDTTPCAGAAYKRYIQFRPNFSPVRSTPITCPGHSQPYDQYVVYQNKFR